MASMVAAQAAGLGMRRPSAVSHTQGARARCLVGRPNGRHLSVSVRASAEAAAQKTFLQELREYSMQLHTKAQAPKEGKAAEPKQQRPFNPTRAGFMRFMVESKVVYEAFESILQEAATPYYKQLTNTGLERTEALAKDIAHMQQAYGLEVPVAAEDGPGHKYAAKLRELAATSPPAFLCHYFNHYFAHTAGGRMIGKSVSNSVLDGWMGAFYEWEGDVKEHQAKVRDTINDIASQWSQEEKDACLKATPATFGWGGRLVQLITEGQPMGH